MIFFPSATIAYCKHLCMALCNAIYVCINWGESQVQACRSQSAEVSAESVGERGRCSLRTKNGMANLDSNAAPHCV